MPAEEIRLINQTGDDVDESFVRLSRERPELVLNTLEQLWQSEGSLVRDSPILQDKLRQISVLCHSGITRPLWEAYMPFHHLTKKCEEFMTSDEAFPFLDFGRQISEDELNGRWSFLWRELGVSKNDDLSFLFDVLTSIRDANPNGLPISRCRDLVRFYCELEAMCAESDEPASARDSCRSFFEDAGVITVLDFVGSDSHWAVPSQCLWDAPSFITTKLSLRHIYEDIFLCSKNTLGILSDFFHRTICVPSLSWEDLVVDLISLRESGCRDFGRLIKIYEHLDKIRSSSIEEKLRQTFEDEPLIFLTVNGQPLWMRRSQCLWSSPIDISERVSIQDHYSPLETLFVHVLGIERLNVGMVYHKLLGMGLKHPPLKELRDTLLVFNSLILESSELPDPQPLLRRRLFPVRNADGSTAVVSAETDFIIVDRQHLIAPFADRIRVLDLDVQGSLKLKPFLRWSGLDARYLSSCVTESTFVSGTVAGPISSPTRDIKKKAHALLRIAAAFNSPLYKRDHRKLSRLLQTAEMLETDGISTILNIIQDGKVISSRVMKGDVHFGEGSNDLPIYVPSESELQDICFAAVLPKKLAGWLMEDSSMKRDDVVVRIVAAVLHYDGAVLDAILDREGVGEIEDI
ncbi:hypothetical protein PT974_08050 [Cladobotryum mycophilum]|uniref:Uncharacterized protein n=1 Tax=Cladobotryum mycophilum TaxID=491253 RepID=A0ABR0SCA3_9HYPO